MDGKSRSKYECFWKAICWTEGKNSCPQQSKGVFHLQQTISKYIMPQRQLNKPSNCKNNLWSCFNGAFYMPPFLFCSYLMKRCWVITACWRLLRWKERGWLSITLLSLSYKTFRRGISFSKKEQRYSFSS